METRAAAAGRVRDARAPCCRYRDGAQQRGCGVLMLEKPQQFQPGPLISAEGQVACGLSQLLAALGGSLLWRAVDI